MKEPVDTVDTGGLATDGEFWHLRLYVAGESTRSLRAFANLKAMCEQYLKGRYEIEIIDLIENPTLAAADDIVALPTLVRRLPAPLRRVIGDLSDTEKLLVSLRVMRTAAALADNAYSVDTADRASATP